MDARTTAIMRMTPRDCVLAQILGELRYLTAAQIQQVCFTSASIATTSQRLTRLRRGGLLACLTHRSFDDRRAFWGLTALGRAVAARLAGWAPADARADATAALQMPHLIATNQLFCDLCAQQRSGRLSAFRWYGSHHAAMELDGSRVVPDAVIVSRSADGATWMYCVEVDLGTMPPAALAAKFRRYRLLHHVAALRSHDPMWEVRASSWVLFACADPRRAALSAQIAKDTGVDRFWAGTMAELPAGLADSVGVGGALFPEELPGFKGGVLAPDHAMLSLQPAEAVPSPGPIQEVGR